MTNIISATYSVEDNKLRLYSENRLDTDTYERVKKMGFKWAPVQKLFVAPKWTPYREDLCIELAGEITAEQTTIVERAEAKAKRLDRLAEKRAAQSSAFQSAATRISERFSGGQPILIGHHSERRARKDQERMQSAMAAAVKAQEAVSYWQYRAEGVECHANMKSNPRVRANRIKTLLKELRDWQREINHAHLCLKLWTKIDQESDVERREKLAISYFGSYLKTGSPVPYYQEKSLHSQVQDEDISVDEAIAKCIDYHDFRSENPYFYRWINHILNRLAYEREELGGVDRFEGELTPVVLQVFAREQGAHKPKATVTSDGIALTSSTPLPLHIAEGNELTLSVDDWRDMLHSVGYTVPAKKPGKPPILNFKAGYIHGRSWGGIQVFRQIELTKAEYSEIYADYRGVKPSECGQFRFKICKNPEQSGYNAEWCAVFLSDSKIHDTPDSSSIQEPEKEIA